MYTVTIDDNIWQMTEDKSGDIMAAGKGYEKKDECLACLKALMGNGRYESLLRGRLRFFKFVDAKHVLLGSDTQPAVLYVGNMEVPLGDVVRKALELSNLNQYEWNKLSSVALEYHIEQAVTAMKLTVDPPGES